METGETNDLLISMLEQPNLLINSGAIYVKMNVPLLEENHLLICWKSLSFLNLIGNRNLDLFYEVSFFWGSLLCLYISHVTLDEILLTCLGWWSQLLFRYFRYKLQKQICETGVSSFAASLEPLTHRRNVAWIKSFL